MEIEIEENKIIFNGKTYALVEKQDPIDHELEEARKKYEGKLLEDLNSSFIVCKKVYRQEHEPGHLIASNDKIWRYLSEVSIAPFQPPVWKCCHTEPPDNHRMVAIRRKECLEIIPAWKGAETWRWWDGVHDYQQTASEFKDIHPNAKWCELPKGGDA